MSSGADSHDEDAADVGLLSPVVAGTTVERLTGDAAVVAAMVRAEVALLRALVDTGVLPTEASTTADLLEKSDLDVRGLALEATTGGNPVIPLVERLRALAGPQHAGWVHHGATSQDVLDTALMLVAADAVREVLADLGRLAVVLAGLADEHRDLPVVARTLTQQAMPTTFGMRAAGWLAGVQDAVLAVRACSLPASLGGPVGTTAAYGARGPAVVDAFAGRLGLATPVLPWHTHRAPLVSLASALVQVTGACGKLAADVLVLSQTEVGEVREGPGGGSSSMPHKANPARSALVASAARQAPALASVVGTSAAAEQERPAGAWHAEWHPLRTLLRLAGGAAQHTATLAEQLHLDRDAMAANLDRLVATLGEDTAWVERQTATTSAWVDRVLARQTELFR